MPVFYAEFRTQLEDYRKNPKSAASFIYRWYRIGKPTKHDAMPVFSRLIPFLQDTENIGWKLIRVSSNHPGEDTVFHPMPPDLSEYQSSFYDPIADYEYMVIEGTRLLEIPDDGKSSGYGAYVVNRKTGAASYACANGTFFTHGRILEHMRKIHRRCPDYDPTDSYVWHPVLFPYAKEDGEPRINFAYYLASEPILSFPMQFWGHASYDQQVKWLAEQEGFA